MKFKRLQSVGAGGRVSLNINIREVAMRRRTAIGSLLAAAALSVSCLFSSGCGTIINLTGDDRPAVYGGVKHAAEMIRCGFVWIADPPNFEPIGGQTSRAWGFGIALGGIADTPLSIIGDTFLYPLIIIRQREWDRHAAQRRMQAHRDAEYSKHVLEIYNRYKFADGPLVEFEDVIRSPSDFSGQVLRSRVGVQPSAPGTNAVTMGHMGPGGVNRLFVVPKDNPLCAASNVMLRYWCSGKIGAETGTNDWVVLSSPWIVYTQGTGSVKVCGTWDVQILVKENAASSSAAEHPAWQGEVSLSESSTSGGRLTLQYIKDNGFTPGNEDGILAGKFSRHYNADGAMWGHFETSGIFKGFLFLKPILNGALSKSLNLTISPYGDLGAGEIIFAPGANEEYICSLRIKKSWF